MKKPTYAEACRAFERADSLRARAGTGGDELAKTETGKIQRFLLRRR